MSRRLFDPTYPVQPSSLGEHLRRRRLDLNFSQAAVAKRLGANETCVWNWEKNRSSPALRFVPRIIEFLGYAPDDSKPESLGQRIVAFRRIQGLTQKELARRLGIDPSTVASWEWGEHEPSMSLAERLEQILGSD